MAIFYSNCSEEQLNSGYPTNCFLFYEPCLVSPASNVYVSNGNYGYQTDINGFITNITPDIVNNYHIYYTCTAPVNPSRTFVYYCGPYVGDYIYVNDNYYGYGPLGCCYVTASNVNFGLVRSLKIQSGTMWNANSYYYSVACNTGPCP